MTFVKYQKQMLYVDSGVLVNDSLKRKALIHNACPFARCRYSHHGRFQPTDVTLLSLKELCTTSSCEPVWPAAAHCWGR